MAEPDDRQKRPKMQDEWLEGGDVWTRSNEFLDLVRFEVLDLVHRLWPGGAWKADMPDLVQGVKVDLVHCPATFR